MRITEPLWSVIALAVGVASFVAGNVIAEVKRQLNPATQPISAYLTGPYGVWESGGFLIFSLGLLALLGSGPVWWQGAVAGTAVALWFVVLSKWILKYGLYGWLFCKNAAEVEHIHLISAGFSFALAVGMEVGVLWGHPAVLIPFVAPFSALIFTLFDRSQTAIEEKTYTIFLLAGMIAVLTVFLSR